MNVIQSHCDLRLGDNLAALHFLRALAKAHPEIHFRHAARLCYLEQLIDLTCDLPNLQLVDIAFKNYPSLDLWKNGLGYWENHALKNDYAAFMLDFFALSAKRIDLDSPFANPEDLLFDYPALRKENLPLKIEGRLDFLIVNSPPMSGQWRNGNAVELNTLVQSLAQRHSVVTTHRIPGLRVSCTQDIPQFSVTNIGQLSQHARNIVMVSTGPSWPTFNVWNKDTVEFRLILIDSEVIGLTPPEKTVQCHTVAEAWRVLKVRGLL